MHECSSYLAMARRLEIRDPFDCLVNSVARPLLRDRLRKKEAAPKSASATRASFRVHDCRAIPSLGEPWIPFADGVSHGVCAAGEFRWAVTTKSGLGAAVVLGVWHELQTGRYFW